MKVWPSTGLTLKEKQAVQAFLGRLTQEFPDQILQIILFGSKARGDSHPWSDIDILIILAQESWPLRQRISTIAADVSLECDVIIGPRVIGQERWERMRQHGFRLYRSVIAEGIPLATAPTFSSPAV